LIISTYCSDSAQTKGGIALYFPSDSDLEFLQKILPPDSYVESLQVRGKEIGIEVPDSMTLHHLGFLVRVLKAKQIVVLNPQSPLWPITLRKAQSEAASLTVIESDVENCRQIREAAQSLNLTLRVIEAKPEEVLPRMSESAYDIALLAGVPTDWNSWFDAVYQLVKPGGLLFLTNPLARGKTSDLSQRDVISVARRSFVQEITQDKRFQATILPLGIGLVCLEKLEIK
jgi:predicted O-methyltransferase YrrM